MSADLEPASFRPVVLRRHFDLQAYQELGLDLAKMIDPTKGKLRQVRDAASRYDSLKTLESGWDLRETYGNLVLAMLQAEGGLIKIMDDVTPEHPALQSYAERCPEVLENASAKMWITSRNVLEEEIAKRRWFRLILVTPNPDTALDEQAPLYRAIEGQACSIGDPREVAPQLTQARIAIAGIVGL